MCLDCRLCRQIFHSKFSLVVLSGCTEQQQAYCCWRCWCYFVLMQSCYLHVFWNAAVFLLVFKVTKMYIHKPCFGAPDSSLMVHLTLWQNKWTSKNSWPSFWTIVHKCWNGRGQNWIEDSNSIMCKQKLSVFSATEEKDLNDTEQNFLVHSTDSTSNDSHKNSLFEGKYIFFNSCRRKIWRWPC